MATSLEVKKDKKQLRVLTLGKAGVGKSSILNAILGKRDAFKEHFGPEHGTLRIEHEHVILGDDTLEVHGYDTHGLSDKEIGEEAIVKVISDNPKIKVTWHNFDIILVCVKFNDRFSCNESIFKALSYLNGNGDGASDLWSKVFVALTYSDLKAPHWKGKVSEEAEKIRIAWVKDIHSCLEELKVTTEIPVHLSTHVSLSPDHLLGWREKFVISIAETACLTPEAMFALVAASEGNVRCVLKAIADKVKMAMPTTVDAALKVFRAMCKLVGWGHEILDKLSKLANKEFHMEDITNVTEPQQLALEGPKPKVPDNSIDNTSPGSNQSAAGVVLAVGAGIVVTAGACVGVAAIAMSSPLGAVACVGGGLVLGIGLAALYLWKRSKK